MRHFPPLRPRRLRQLLDALIPPLIFIVPLVALSSAHLLRPHATDEKAKGVDASEAPPDDIVTTPGHAPPIRLAAKMRAAALPEAEKQKQEAPKLGPIEQTALATAAAARECASSETVGGHVAPAKEETPIWPALAARKPMVGPDGKQKFLDPRYDLEVLQTKGDWLQVRVIAPNWPGKNRLTGWVLRHYMQQIATDDARKCLFVDVSQWADVPENRRSMMRDMALRILQEDTRCERISAGGSMANGLRFYFTCYPRDGGKPYHHWLTAASQDKHFTPPAPVSDGEAMSLCRAELEKALRNKALIAGNDAPDVVIGGTHAYLSQSVHYVELDYRQGDGGGMEKAFCLAPPGAGAEITLSP